MNPENFGTKSVLFVEGYSPNGKGDFELRFKSAFENRISYSCIEAVRIVANNDLQKFDASTTLEDYYTSFVEYEGLGVVPRIIGLGAFIQKIESGLFHAVVFVNASGRKCKGKSLDESLSLDFEEHPLMSGVLGSTVEKFVRNGGVAIFCAEESNRTLLGSLQYLFRVNWSGIDTSSLNKINKDRKRSWYPVKENAKKLVRSFGALVDIPRTGISSDDKATLELSSVKPSQRCFVCKSDDEKSDSFDQVSISVAFEEYGNQGGSIAYFGDSKCSTETIDLIAAYVMMRSSKEPIKSEKVELADEDFTELMKLKDHGNDAFRAGDYGVAICFYLDALCFYETYSVKYNPHYVEEHLTLHALLSLCYIRMEQWFEAQTCAENVLKYNPNHEQSILNIATAAIGLIKSETSVTVEWKISTLTQAKKDLQLLDESSNPEIASNATQLSRTIQQMLIDLNTS